MATIRVLPHNEDAEKSVLGAILIDKDAINIASEILVASHFYNDLHALVYDAMLALHEERKPIDLLTITTLLKKKDRRRLEVAA